MTKTVIKAVLVFLLGISLSFVSSLAFNWSDRGPGKDLWWSGAVSCFSFLLAFVFAIGGFVGAAAIIFNHVESKDKS